MRKIILFVFLLTLAPIASFAATSCPTAAEGANPQSCSTNKGCYWNTTNKKCELCPAGTYNDGNLISKTYCLECLATGTGTNLKWDDTTGLESTADCKWTANCAAGEYVKTIAEGCKKCSDLNNINTATFYYGPETPTTFTGTLTDGYPTNNVCKRCPDNSRTNSEGTGCECIKPYYMSNGECLPCGANASPNADGTNCNCNSGYHKTGGTNSDTTNVGKENCVANTITITLYPNYNPKKDNGMYHFTYANHYPYNEPNKETVTIETTIGTVNPADVELPDEWTRIGWEFVCWSEYSFYSSDDPNCFSKGNHSKTTYYAKWRPSTYQVNYYQDEFATEFKTKKCTFGTICRLGDPNIATAPAGKVFRNWTCDMKDEPSVQSGCTQEKIAGGSRIENKIDISVIKEPVKYLSDTDKTFTPYKIYGIWAPCPAGYYCTPYRYECPAGTTSDAGSDEKKDCYMLGETTKIEGDNGTFTLPTDLKLYYRGS